MAIDRTEQFRRGQSATKATTKHPYAAIEHRVIDSPAFADLTFSARSLLVLIARQLTKDNNGRLQATFSYMRRFGFESDRTVSRAVAELIAHGMIYRTRSGGYQQGAALYAVTWLSIKQREGLFLDGFLPCAWRDWQPEKNKIPPSKIRHPYRKIGGLTPAATDKIAVGYPVKSTDYELMPVVGVKVPLFRAWIEQRPAMKRANNPLRPRHESNRPLLRNTASVATRIHGLNQRGGDR